MISDINFAICLHTYNYALLYILLSWLVSIDIKNQNITCALSNRRVLSLSWLVSIEIAAVTEIRLGEHLKKPKYYILWCALNINVRSCVVVFDRMLSCSVVCCRVRSCSVV